MLNSSHLPLLNKMKRLNKSYIEVKNMLKEKKWMCYLILVHSSKSLDNTCSVTPLSIES